MRIPQSVWLSLFVLIGLAAAWRFWPGKNSSSKAPLIAPRLELTWSGEFVGKASLPIDFTWCPGQRVALLEAISVSGDTGLMVVFHEADSLAPVSHPVYPPERIEAVAPWANAGMRFARDSSVAGYSSMSGKIELSGSTAQLVGGDFTMVVRRPGKPDTLVVNGRFPPTTVVGRSAGCN